MKIVFWISFLIIMYGYVGYPILLIIISLIKGVNLPKRYESLFEPNVSLIIPVYNEEKIIEEKIQNTLSLDYPKDKIEILLISDGSTDRTREIVRGHEKEGIKLFEQPIRKGKANALNLGLKEAKNEIIVFSDASILLERDATRNILSHFSDPWVGCVSGEDYIPGSGGEGFYGKYELYLRNLESRVGSIVGASGCFYAQRRELCDFFPEGMAPDFFSVLKTVEKGYRAVTAPMAKGIMRSVPNPKNEFERKVRTLLRGITTLFRFKNLLNPFRYGMFSIQLISHKIIRWIVGFFLILLFLSNLFLLSSKLYLLFFVLQIVFYSLALIGLIGFSKHFIFRIPLFFSMVNFSALWAWVKYFRGIRQEIWEPSKRR